MSLILVLVRAVLWQIVAYTIAYTILGIYSQLRAYINSVMELKLIHFCHSSTYIEVENKYTLTNCHKSVVA